MKKNKKGPARLIGRSKMCGFTLIELLVVIGIISILLAIVLTVVNNAKTKSNNSAVMGAMDTIRKQAEIYITNNLKYGTTSFNTASISNNCNTATGNLFDDPTILAAVNQIGKNVGGSSTVNIACTMNISTNTWAIAVLLNGGLGTYCRDSRSLPAKIDSTKVNAFNAVVAATSLCN